MVPKSAVIVLAPLLALSVLPSPSGQRAERSFFFAHTPSVTGFQEILTVLRTVALIPNVSADVASSSVKVTGTPDEIALADWMVQALDQMPVADHAVHEYRTIFSRADTVRMFYLSEIKTPLDTQELITILRVVGHLQYVFQYTSPHILAVRGTTDQLALASWMINELDQPAGVNSDGTHQFRSSEAQFPVVRAFYLTHRTPKDLQDTLTAIRADVHIQRAFSHTARGVVILAGTPGQVDDAARLLAEKDRGTGN